MVQSKTIIMITENEIEKLAVIAWDEYIKDMPNNPHPYDFFCGYKTGYKAALQKEKVTAEDVEINLEELQKEIDNLLDNETGETLLEWYNKKFPSVNESKGSAGSWISVADRLPEDGIKVLIMIDGEIELDSYDIDSWLEHYYDVRTITHWMPLPAPPQPKQKED